MNTTQTTAGPRLVRAPRGTEISCRGWQQEAALRMLMNNLDPEVAEAPDERPPGTLSAWAAWEERHPDAFAGMYQFWCSRR